MKIEYPNNNYLKEISGDDDALFEHLLQLVKREFPQEKATFLENFGNTDFQKSAESVHKLKHKINILGLEQGHKVASQFEKELHEGLTHSYSDFLVILDSIEVYLTTC